MVPNGASCGIICTFFVAEFPIKTATCLQVGPMSLEWPVDPFARCDLSRPSLFPEVPNNDQQRGALPASTRSHWRQNALQAPPQVLQRITGWDGHGPFLAEGLQCITWNTRVSLDLFSLSRRPVNSSSNTSNFFKDNNIVCLQEVHGKGEYLQAIQVFAPRFRLFGTFFPENEKAGGSAICIHKDLLPELAIVTHLITCQGRDHIVHIQYG